MEKNIIKGAVAGVATAFTYLFGAWDMALKVLVTLMLLDYGTGVLRGWVSKELSSNIGLVGIARKGLILAVLIVAGSLDRLIGGDDWVFRTLVCYFYIANEGISIIENCGAMGAPIPEPLMEALVQLKSGNKKDIKKSK